MSKFKRIAPRHAKSADGFEIRFHGLEKLLYIERLPSGEKRCVTVSFETLMAPVSYDLFVGEQFLHHWDPPHSTEALRGEERARVIKNVTEALDFLGSTYTLSD